MNMMTPDEIYAFINNNRLTAHLATVRKDGRPHVAPIWITTDGTDIVFNTGKTTVKGRNLQRTGYAALSMDDSVPPFDCVRLEGPVTFSEDPEELLHWATVLGGRYMGEENAEAYGKRNGVPGELVVRMTPSHIMGIKGDAAMPGED